MRIISIIFCLFAFQSSYAQTAVLNEDNHTQQVDIDAKALHHELSVLRSQSITLPLGGEPSEYTVTRVYTMTEDFYELYPDILSYKIVSKSDPYINGRITSTKDKVWVTWRDREGYRSIFPQNGKQVIERDVDHLHTAQCSHDSHNPDHINQEWEKKVKTLPDYRQSFSFGETGRRYRIAVVCTGEFYQANGGNDASALAAIASTIDGLNAIYNNELNVDLVGLVPKLYPDPGNDPFIPDNAGGDNRPNQAGNAVVAWFIDKNSYDIGHVFHTTQSGDDWSGGGVAQLNAVCSENTFAGPFSKARGWSGSFSNVGFGWLNLAAHELAHMFGAHHTFNGIGESCTDAISMTSAFEIGSGTSIMSYSGSCDADQNIQETNDDDYFHIRSILQMSTYIVNGGDCAVQLNTNNTAPVVNANPCGLTYSIPKSTPYRIRGEATDAEDNPMTYTWEQYDEDGDNNKSTQGDIGNAAANNTVGPLVRSLSPRSDQLERTIPKMSTIVAGLTSDPFEVLSRRARQITFQLTARDNNSSGGAISTEELVINCMNLGPFRINNPGIVNAGEATSITWNTGNSDELCDLVNVYLSLDNGTSFPITLAEGVSYASAMLNLTFSLGLTNVDDARIMVECADNDCVTFFAMSTAFRIISDCDAPGTYMCDNDPVTADQGDPSLNFDLSTYLGTEVTTIDRFISNSSDEARFIRHGLNNVGCDEAFTIRHEDVTFAILESGTYNFRPNNSNGSRPVITIFEADTYNPNNQCSSLVASAARKTDTGTSWSYFLPVELDACKTYILRLYNFDLGSMSIVPITGPGPIIELDEAISIDYSTTYVAVREDGLIGGVSDVADFTTLSGGKFNIHAISYKSGGATPPAIVDPSTWVGSNISTLYTNGDCSLRSVNAKPVEVLSGCGILTITAMDQTACDPATNTYNQVLEIAYENPPPSGMLRVNGVTFAIAGSPQLVNLQGLISDGQPIDVSAEFTDQPGCALFLQDVFTAPESCCPIDVELGDDLSSCDNDLILLDAGEDGESYQWLQDGETIVGATQSTFRPTVTGLYKVEITAPAGCVVADQVSVTIYPAPQVVLPEDRSLCEGDTYTIEGMVGAATLVWEKDGFTVNGENTSSLEVSEGDQYVLIATTDNECVDRDTINIELLPVPSVNLGDDQELCADEAPYTLDAGAEGSWIINNVPLSGTPSSLEANTSGEYIVTVVNDEGCPTSDTVIIEYFDLPQANAGEDQSLCVDGAASLLLVYNAFGGTFVWFKGTEIHDNQDDPLIVTSPGEYILEVRNEIGCTVRDTVIITEILPPVVDLGMDIVGCEGSDVVLSTELDGTYFWLREGEGPIGNESQININTAGTYILLIVNGSMCEGRDTIDISFEPGPGLEIGDDITICQGEEAMITATTEESVVVWKLGDDIISGENGKTITVSEAGTYTASVAGSSGCMVEDFLTVVVNPLPVVDIGDDRGICDGESVMLTAGVMATSYQWLLPNGEMSTLDNVEISTAGEVTLTVTNEFDCTASDMLTVTVGDNPTLTLEDQYRFCEGMSVDIEAQSDASSFEWTVNGMIIAETGATITIDEATTVSVIATNNENCMTSDMTTVTSSPSPTVDLGVDMTLCPGDDITLLAGDHTTYEWSTSDTGNSITISNTGTTEVTNQTITVLVTNEDDCPGEDEIIITLLPELMPMVASSAPGVCGGEPVTLTATGGSSFSWVDVSGTLSQINGATAVASPTETTSYEVIAANEECPESEVSTTIVIEVFEKGDDVSAGEDECAILGQSLTLDATGGVVYQWTSVGPFVGPSNIADPEVNPTEETVYAVTITDINGCSYTDSVTICILEDPLSEFMLVSIITPNGDGDNDNLFFKGLQAFPENTLTIYNRWGNVVYEKSRYQQENNIWDGKNGGEDLAADTYYYILTFDGNTYKSTVTIMR